MWLGVVGLAVQAGVLFSLTGLLRPPLSGTLRDQCDPQSLGPAFRAVLLLGDWLPPREDSARARLLASSGMFQWNAVASVLAGTPSRWILGTHHPLFDSLLSRAETTVYVGSRSLALQISKIGANHVVFHVLDDDPAHSSNLQDIDQFVFDTIHEVLSENSAKKPNLTESETCLFILYSSLQFYSAKVPRSRQTEAKFVENIRKLENKMMERFQDNRTVYVFMPEVRYLDVNAPVEVQVWGAGVKPGYYPPLHLEDICPLISSALGLQFPLYSHGKLPLSFLDYPLHVQTFESACNALQLYQLAFGKNGDNQIVHGLQESLVKYDQNKGKQLAEEISHTSIVELNTSTGKLNGFIALSVMVTLVGWILVIITHIGVSSFGEALPSRNVFVVMILLMSVALIVINVLIFQFSPNFYYICFCNLPIIPICILIVRYKLVHKLLISACEIKALLYIPAVIGMSELLLVAMTGELWSGLVLSLIPVLVVFPPFKESPYIFLGGWVLLTFVLCQLMLSPAELPAHRSLQDVNVAATVWMCLGGVSFLFMRGAYSHTLAATLLACLAGAAILAAMSMVTDINFRGMRISAWILATLATLLPLAGKRRLPERLIHMALGFATPVVLMSRRLELLSFGFLVAYAFLWIYLEYSHMHLFKGQYHPLRRGFLISVSMVIGYLLMGKLEYNSFFSKGILVLFSETFDHRLYIFFISIRYCLMFISITMIYRSLIKFQWPSDNSFLYAYLLMELVCLRRFVQLCIFGSDISEDLFNNVLVNSIAMLIVLSYLLSSIYSAPLPEDKLEELPPVPGEAQN